MRINLVEPARLAEEIILHAEGAVDVVTDCEPGVVRGHDPAHSQRAHHFAKTDRRDVGLAFVHPAAHGRVQGQVFVLDQDLACSRFADRYFLIGEGFPGRGAHRAFGEEKLAIGLGRHGRHSG
ncbi:hypothetical protein D3C76_861850 [compost metagenome]